MLKPLAMKKAIVLPSPQSYLEEWHVHVQHRTGETLQSVLQQHGAALRIQLRYKKYQDKVRALLKKSEKAIDEHQQQDAALTSATGSAKAALRERSVAGSSMALAVAYNVRKDPATSSSSSSNSSQDGSGGSAQPLVLKAANGSLQSYTHELRASRKEPPSKWNAPDWRCPEPSRDMLSPSRHDTTTPEPRNDSLETATLSNALPVANGEDEANDDSSDSTETAQNALVDIMHHSWLLASMEERCADAAASVGAQSRSRSSPSSQLHVADFRHTVLDLVFIARSGVGHNLHGRAPSTVAVHRQNLLKRVQQAAASDRSDLPPLSAADTLRVKRIFASLQSDMLLPAVRTLGWLLTKTWRLLFDGVHIDVASLHAALDALATAQQTHDVSVVFAPTHKTHLDYLLLSYVCFAYGVPLPRIAAGNNLDLPVIGAFLRANGSFFIRRSFRDDALYRHVLESYVHELLHDGNPIEVFVEGGRSRHGRVGKPKLGFLTMFQTFVNQSQLVPKVPESDSDISDSELAQPQKPRAVMLVPIALDYDKVYEVEEYANQLLGKPKQRESIKGLLSALWDIAFLRCGHAYVRFGAPLALTADTKVSLDDTARELAVRMQTSGTVTSTSIVAALLLWKRAFMTRDMLTTRVHWLLSELETRDAHVAHVAADKLADHALAVLHVGTKSDTDTKRKNDVLAPQLEFPTRALELAFYRNHLLHVFLPELAVVGAIDALLRSSTNGGINSINGITSISGIIGIHGALRTTSTSTRALPLAAVEETALMMWNFLRHICRHAPVDVPARIAAFAHAHADVVHVEAACADTDDTNTSGPTQQQQLLVVDCARWRTHKLVGFSLSLLWPFVDSLWLCAHGLWSLLPAASTIGATEDTFDTKTEHTERDVVRRVQQLARELFLQRALVHAEAFCSESIKQSLDFLVERAVIRFVPARDGHTRAVALCASARDGSAFVQALVDEVNGWRRPATRRLWCADAVSPVNLTRDAALALMAGSDTCAARGVYDTWMTPTRGGAVAVTK